MRLPGYPDHTEDIHKVVFLAQSFGTMGGYDTAWKKLDALNYDIRLGVERLWMSVQPVVLARLDYAGGVTQTPDRLIEEAKRIGDLLQIDVQAIYDEVAQRKGFTEPKSWAAQEAKEAAAKKEKPVTISEPRAGVCRVCGCTEERACVGNDNRTCEWVGLTLCSFCAEAVQEIAERGYEGGVPRIVKRLKVSHEDASKIFDRIVEAEDSAKLLALAGV